MSKSARASGTVLLVDDRDEVRAAQGELIETLGFEVITAASPEAAERLFRATPRRFGALVADLDMPETDGLELASRLRELRPELPVLILSSAMDDPRIRACTRAGDIAFLRKPTRARDLAEALARLEPPRPGAPTEPPARRAGRRWPPLPLGSRAALFLALLGASVLALTLVPAGPPPLPPPPVDLVVRGPSLSLEAPSGLLTDRPEQFSWSSLSEARRYRVALEAVDGSTIWSAETAAVQVSLPPPVHRELQRGVAYFWQVHAFDEHSRVLAVSKRVRFQVQLTPSQTP